MKRIALAQMNIIYGDPQKNENTARSLLTQAVHERCDLILFPELWSSGFDLHNISEYAVHTLELLAELQKVSDDSNMIIGGSFIEKQGNAFYNAFYLLQPHLPYAIYRKNHLFSMMHEDKYFSPGSESITVNTPLGITGLSICFDLRFPELFRSLQDRGAECFLICSHWPAARIHHWDILLQARAIENQAFMIAVNSVGQSGKDFYGGHSMIIAPDGEILLQASDKEEGLFIANIDPSKVGTLRQTFKFRQSSARS